MAALLKKYPIESAITITFVVVLLGALIYPLLSHGQQPAGSVQAQLREPPPFSQLQRYPGQTRFSLDSIAQGSTSALFGTAKNGRLAVTFSRAQPMQVNGWAVDGSKEAGGVYVLIDGTTRIPAYYGVDRPDVARVLGAPDARYVGFTATLPSNTFRTAGSHTIGVLVVSSGGSGYYREGAHGTVTFAQ
ncbi:MAG TPA: hypothetical protein VMD91_07110 [Candidatus Sulfotelmatobacter sp.]|nr:hypothetical protein [Candidatus Sulfotelmatobacter sp.]